MKTFYCNDDSINRECFLVLRSLYEIYKIDAYSSDLDNIPDIINNFKPELIVVSTDQYRKINKKLEEMNKNFHTKIIVVGQEISKNKKFKTITIDSNSFDLFNEYHVPKKIDNTIEYWVCDLDKSNLENNHLLSPYIYPKNTTNAVKLVGCDKVKHPQNLGNVTEEDMLDLIYNSCGFINVTNKYIHDAISMKKPILNLVENNWLKSNNFVILESLPIKKLSETIKSCVKI